MRRVRQARAHEHSVRTLQGPPLLRQEVSEARLAVPQEGVRRADHAAAGRTVVVSSHLLGARGAEFHIPNFWPAWSIRFWQLLQEGSYVEAQREFARVIVPFYALWGEMGQHTGGDGYLDKLCMELVGLPSSRCRPPTRDVREEFRDRARQMLVEFGVPELA